MNTLDKCCLSGDVNVDREQKGCHPLVRSENMNKVSSVRDYVS